MTPSRHITAVPRIARAIFGAAVCLGACLLSVSAVRGHDLWLEPPAPVEGVDEPIRIEGRVGHGGVAELFRRNPARIVRLEAHPPSRSSSPSETGPPEDLPGLDGSTLLGALRPDVPGTWIVVYESHPFRHVLSADRFAAYLDEEGLDAVAAAREAAGTTDTPGVERVSRSAKTLVAVGGRPLEDRRVGLPVELIAEALPGDSSGAGDDGPSELVLRLEIDGRPASGRLVDLRRLDVDAPTRSARTDAAGRVRFEAGPGRWLAAVVEATAHDEPSDADWRTIFGSWTVDLRELER